MKRLLLLVMLLAAGLVLNAPRVLAQDEDMEMEMEMEEEGGGGCKFICAPVFLFMPGFVATNVIDPPETATGDEAESSTDFLLRFQVVAPTFIPRTSLVVLTQWTPFATAGETPDIEEEEQEINDPAFVYGLIITLFDTQYLAASFDPLMVYSPSADPDDSADYTHKFALELALVPKLGNMMNMDPTTFGGSLAAYALLDYVVTGLPDSEDVGGDEFEPDPWVILFGIIIPLAPFPGS